MWKVIVGTLWEVQLLVRGKSAGEFLTLFMGLFMDKVWALYSQ
jgi:hypothetical protein